MIGIDEVAQLASHQGASTLRVLAQHHLVPDSHQINTVNLYQCEPLHRADKRGYIDWVGHGNSQATRGFDGFRHPRDRQNEVPGALQFPQRFVAAADLQTFASEKLKCRHSALDSEVRFFVIVAGEMTANDVNRFGLPKGSLDLVLLLHLCRINKTL